MYVYYAADSMFTLHPSLRFVVVWYRPAYIHPSGAFILICLNKTQAWISHHMLIKVWDKCTYPFPNFNGATVEAWEWMSNFFSDFTRYLITYPCCDSSWTMFIKGALWVCQWYWGSYSISCVHIDSRVRWYCARNQKIDTKKYSSSVSHCKELHCIHFPTAYLWNKAERNT